MAADRLTLDVDGHTVVFTEPGKARAAARRWRRMAAELEGSNTPEVTFKQHELRARAKAAEDWARAGEERDFRTSPPADNVSAAPAGEPPPPPSPGARRQAAATLTKSGVRKGRRAASRARRAARSASRKYEAAGGAPVATSTGEFVVFLVGGIVLLILLEDMLTKKGSHGVSGASKTAAAIAHRVIEPVPIVTKA